MTKMADCIDSLGGGILSTMQMVAISLSSQQQPYHPNRMHLINESDTTTCYIWFSCCGSYSAGAQRSFGHGSQYSSSNQSSSTNMSDYDNNGEDPNTFFRLRFYINII